MRYPALTRQLAVALWRYEADEPHVNSPDLDVGSEENQHYPNFTWEELLAHSRQEHFGDCVNQANTCERCLAEHILHKADWLASAAQDSIASQLSRLECET